MTTNAEAVLGIVLMRRKYKVQPNGVSGLGYNRKKANPDGVSGKVLNKLTSRGEMDVDG